MATQLRSEGGPNSAVRWILPGLIAGLVFAMWAMMVGLFTSTLWAAPQGIAQSVGIGSQGHDFQAIPFLVGLMGHMMNSIVIGVVFVVLARAMHLRGMAALIGGMMLGLIAYGAMFWVLLRGMLASTSGSFLSANPEWSWIVGHLMFGVVLGGLVAYGPLRQRNLEPAGRPVLT